MDTNATESRDTTPANDLQQAFTLDGRLKDARILTDVIRAWIGIQGTPKPVQPAPQPTTPHELNKQRESFGQSATLHGPRNTVEQPAAPGDEVIEKAWYAFIKTMNGRSALRGEDYSSFVAVFRPLFDRLRSDLAAAKAELEAERLRHAAAKESVGKAADKIVALKQRAEQAERERDEAKEHLRDKSDKLTGALSKIARLQDSTLGELGEILQQAETDRDAARAECERLREGSTTVLQPWTQGLPMMQQTVLLTAIRGPDGLPKYGCVKMLLRWYRRCVLLSAMDGRALVNPYDNNGGSFTGPSLPGAIDEWEKPMHDIVDEYLRTLDAVPHHFQLHLMHAIEIVGYKHPDERIRNWWHAVYVRLVRDMHVYPETEAQLNERLGDDRNGWLRHADEATVK